MKKIAHDILTEARQTRQNYQITGTNFDKIKANMYSIFECYAYGLINWDQVKTRFKKSIREYVSLYKGTKHLKEEIEIMRQEYKNTLRNYKPALDAYRVMSEQKLAAKLVTKNNLSESIAKQHSSTYYNSRMLSENNLTDTVRLTWKRVMEVYPNLTNTDEARVRMLTIFEGPTIDTTQLITTVMKEEPTLISGPMQTSMRPKMRPGRYDDPDQWFNPNAGHRDQPDHPENRGLTDNPSAAPTTSLRPQKRPADLAQRAAVNRAVRSAMGEHSRTEVDPGSTQQSLEGYKVLPNIDRDRYGERDGLEGPFRTLSGKVVYYDPKEGSYYDPDTDMYLSYDEFQQYDNDYSGMKDERDIDVKEEMSENSLSKISNSTSVISLSNKLAKHAGKTVKMSVDTNTGAGEDEHNALYALKRKGLIDLQKTGTEGNTIHFRVKVSKDLKEEVELDEVSNDVKDQLRNIDLEISRLNRRYGSGDIGDTGSMSAPAKIQMLTKQKQDIMKKHSIKEEMTDAEVDAFHRALDAIVHKHIGHSSDEKKKDMNESKIIATGLLRDKPFRKTFKNVEAMRAWADREDADVRGYHAAPGKGEDTQESVTEAVTLDYSRYIRSHGKKPRDTGGATWMFTTAEYGSPEEDEIFNFQGSFADAKKAAAQWARSRGASHVYVMEDAVAERSMTKGEKSKEERLKKKYDDSEMKSSMKDQYGDDWKEVYYATIRKKAMEQFNEMTSAGAIAAVAQPMVKMQRRKKTNEKKKSPAGGPPCWDGKKIHPTKPTKMKGGKRVNNCIDADSRDGK